MTERIKLVQGDNLPFVKLALTNVDGSPMDVSMATVVVYFRAADTTEVLSTLNCVNVNDGVDGIIKFNFPGATLDVEPGFYEGEVEVDFSGQKLTAYKILKFQVREQFN